MPTMTATAAEGTRPFALLAAGVLGRLPAGMLPVAVLLAGRAHGSITLAAGAAAVVALATALIGPVAGRLVDRGGARHVLLGTAMVYPLAVLALAWATRTGAPLPMLTTAMVTGLATPPVGPLVRSRLPRMVPDHAHARIFAAEAASTEVVWIVGPLLVAALAALASPVAALAAIGLFGSIGALACRVLATEPDVDRGVDRSVAPPTSSARVGRHSRRRGTGSGSLRRISLVLTADALTAASIGVLLVAVTEATVAVGAASWTGVVIALWSAGSLVGAAMAGMARSQRPAMSRYAFAVAMLAAATVPLLAVTWRGAPSVALLAVTALVAGMPLAVVGANGNGLIAALVTPAARTEAFAWSAATIALAGAAGSALAGRLLPIVGVRGAVAVALALVTAAALTVAISRAMRGRWGRMRTSALRGHDRGRHQLRTRRRGPAASADCGIGSGRALLHRAARAQDTAAQDTGTSADGEHERGVEDPALVDVVS